MNGLIEWGIFLALAAVAIVTAAGMIITMSMYRAGLALMASFVALAGLFVLLDADLLAAIQVMMNVGGMLVMVLFMVMMMMDPGGEMMWGMKRDMHMRGPGAFSMHMPWGKPPADDQAEQQVQVKDWTCPMHPEISEPTTGTCPKCGMTLIPRAEPLGEQNMHEMDMTDMADTAKIYTCPMHPEVQQNQPGKCPTCGMTLIEQPPVQQQPQAAKIYTCPMHPEIQQDTPGKCPKCGMTLVEQTSTDQADGPMMGMEHMEHMDHDTSTMPMDHTSHAMPEHTMPSTTMNHENKSESQRDHAMDMSNQDMDMGGMTMTPRQNYDMMVDMAMSTTQLPWAIILGVLSALLLIVLVIFTPWPLANTQPTQDATTAVGQLLLSRYMIAFEGAAFLILAGIAGAVILAKRERPEVAEQPEQVAAEEATPEMDMREFTCPMHAEVRQQGAGKCPKCGMDLLPAEAVASNVHDGQGGQSNPPMEGGHS